MPCFDPSQAFWLSFDRDAAKPVEVRPAFQFRALSVREWRAVREESTTRPPIEAAVKILADALTGWKNIAGADGQAAAFDRTAFDALVGIGETWDLFDKFTRETTLSAEDKKKLELPPASAPAGSAGPAASVAAVAPA